MPKAAGDLVVLKEVIEKSITSKEKYTKLVFEIIESVRKSLICLWEKENKFYADLKLENVSISRLRRDRGDGLFFHDRRRRARIGLGYGLLRARRHRAPRLGGFRRGPRGSRSGRVAIWR